jgi:hypothetical protein
MLRMATWHDNGDQPPQDHSLDQDLAPAALDQRYLQRRRPDHNVLDSSTSVSGSRSASDLPPKALGALPEWGLPPMTRHPLSSAGTHTPSSPSSHPPSSPGFALQLQDVSPLPTHSRSPLPSPGHAPRLSFHGKPSPTSGSKDGSRGAQPRLPPIVAPKRKRQPNHKNRKVKLFENTGRTTIPSAEFRQAIAGGDYSIELPPIQLVVASEGLPPVVDNAESVEKLLNWRRIPLFEDVSEQRRAFVLSLGGPAPWPCPIEGMPALAVQLCFVIERARQTWNRHRQVRQNRTDHVTLHATQIS